MPRLAALLINRAERPRAADDVVVLPTVPRPRTSETPSRDPLVIHHGRDALHLLDVATPWPRWDVGSVLLGVAVGTVGTVLARRGH